MFNLNALDEIGSLIVCFGPVWYAIYQLTCGTIRSVMKMEVKLLAQMLPPLPLSLHPSSQPPVCPPERVSGEESIPFTLGSILINAPHSHCHRPSRLLPVFLVPVPLLCLFSLISGPLPLFKRLLNITRLPSLYNKASRMKIQFSG